MMLASYSAEIGHGASVLASDSLASEGLSVLVLDDEECVRETLCTMVSSLGCLVESTGNAESFFTRLAGGGYDVVVIDLVMPECDGLEVLSRMAAFKDTKIIICSGSGIRVLDTVSRSAQSLGLDVLGILQKPFRKKPLKSLLALARKAQKSAERSQTTNEECPEITLPMLLRAIDAREFTCFLQPKLSLTDGSVYGFEALARWQHPDFGMILPDDFIPKVAEFDLDYEFSVVITELALEALAELERSGLSVAVNVPYNVFSRPEFEAVIAALLERHRLTPSQLFLEVTEVGDTCISKAELDSLVRLSLKGHPLSIDDFGTGASSLERLIRIPFDELKIDRMFIEGLETSRHARGLVRNLVHIAKSLNMSVTVEGVESLEAMDILRRLGCDSAQGYVISRPMPIKVTRDWIATFDKS